MHLSTIRRITLGVVLLLTATLAFGAGVYIFSVATQEGPQNSIEVTVGTSEPTTSVFTLHGPQGVEVFVDNSLTVYHTMQVHPVKKNFPYAWEVEVVDQTGGTAETYGDFTVYAGGGR